MSILLDAGLPMPEIMNSVAQTSRNRVVRETVEDMRRQMLQGRGLFECMDTKDMFPPLLVQVTKVGEQAGTLAGDLMATVDIYEQEVDEKVNTLFSVLQPVMLVSLGLIVAFIAVSIIMPIYSIMGSM